MLRLLLTVWMLLCPMLLWAASITSTQTGPWGTGSTWVGGVAPGNGDTVTIAAGHVVTVTDNRTVGHSPGAGDATQAILVAATGQVVVNAGVTLTVRGDIFTSSSNTVRSLVLNPGATLEMDASAAGTPSTARYVIRGTSQYPGSQPSILFNGNAGARCTVRSNAGGANARFTNNSTFSGLVEAYYTDFTRIGDASNFAFAPTMSDEVADPASTFVLDHCTLTACGALDSTHAQFGGYARFVLSNTTWSGTVAAYNIATQAYLQKQAGSNVARTIDNCVFDKHVYTYAPRQMTITNNLFYEGFSTSSTDSVGSTFENNLVCMNSTYNNLVPYSSDVRGNYWLYRDAGATNPHFIEVGNTANLSPQQIRENIFEFVGNDGDGDCILLGFPAAATTIAISRNIFLPNAAGSDSGTPFSAQGNANTSFSFDHNTFFVGTQGAAVGETYAGHTGMITSFRSNIAWDTSARGYCLLDSGGNDSVSNLVTSALLDYNCSYNTLAGSNGHGINNLEFSAGSPGANNVDVNPTFANQNADIASWDASLGGAGTYTNALTELMKLNTPTHNASYTIAALKTYIQNAFRVSNISLRNAGHDGSTIGAQDYFQPGVPGGFGLRGVGK